MFELLRPHSPATPLNRARDAQWLMAGHNRHGQKTYFGPIDGLYYEASGRAADRMRYWLGYPDRDLGGVFGDQLYSYLIPLTDPRARKLPLTYRLRRKARLAAEAKRIAALATSGKRKALAQALTQVRYHEVGYSNNNKFGIWFRFNYVPWCAEFVSWAFRDHLGGRLRTALARQFMYWARSGTFGLRITANPEPGDIVVYDKGQGHVGIFKGWIDRSRFLFEAVEGNTSCAGGSWDNGGEVCVQRRGREKNPVFVRVP